MRLNGFQRILIITAAVLAAVVSSLLIRHYDNNIWEYSLRNWCDDDLPLPQLVACVDGNYQSSRVGDGWKRVTAIIPAVLFRFRRHTGRLRTFHR